MLNVMKDLDGVVCRWTQGFNAWAGRDPNEVWETYAHYKTWGWTSPQFVSELDEFARQGGFRSLEPHGDALVAWDTMVARDDITIHVVTHRPAAAQADTYAWLEENELPYASLTFAGDKAAEAVRLGCDVSIEDSADNAVALAAAGVRSFLMNRPWNQGEFPGVTRVANAHEFWTRVRP